MRFKVAREAETLGFWVPGQERGEEGTVPEAPHLQGNRVSPTDGTNTRPSMKLCPLESQADYASPTFFHQLVAWFWASYQTYLCLNFLIGEANKGAEGFLWKEGPGMACDHRGTKLSLIRDWCHHALETLHSRTPTSAVSPVLACRVRQTEATQKTQGWEWRGWVGSEESSGKTHTNKIPEIKLSMSSPPVL